MTIAVDWDVKQQNKQNKKLNSAELKNIYFQQKPGLAVQKNPFVKSRQPDKGA